MNDPDLISKLKFVGRIKQNEKVNTKYLYTQPDNYVTSITRSLVYQDSRENLVTFLNDIMGKATTLIEDYSVSNDMSKKKLCMNVFSDFINSKEGLKNLIVTYKDDVMFGCRLDTLIQQIESKEFEFNEKLKRIGIFKNRYSLKTEPSITGSLKTESSITGSLKTVPLSTDSLKTVPLSTGTSSDTSSSDTSYDTSSSDTSLPSSLPSSLPLAPQSMSIRIEDAIPNSWT